MAKATIVDVAARAGVGVGTVSRVINGRPRVAPATRERVLAAIAELGFRPNPSARALVQGRTSRLAVVVPFLTNPSFVERLRGVTAVVRPTAYQLVLFAVQDPEHRDECLHELADPQQADGVLLISIWPSDAQIGAFAAAQVPLVLLESDHPTVPSLTLDDVAGGRLATRHLLDLGHRRIGFVGDAPDDRFGFVSSPRRLQGYRDALAEAGIAPDPALVRTGPHGMDTATDLAGELLDGPEPPTAIFAASDTQALGVLAAARTRGLAVPRDLSVIGFDDIDVATHVGLTTVRQHLEDSGRLATELLLETMAASPADGEATPRRVELPMTLVARASTGPAR